MVEERKKNNNNNKKQSKHNRSPKLRLGDIIIMETVACLRSKCHLKQNLIPSWPWSFRHTSCISDFRCKTKYTNKIFCRTPRPAYLAVLPVLVIFCPLAPTNFKKSGSGGLPFCNVFPLLIVNRFVGFHFNAYHSLYWENCIFRKKMQEKKGK